MDNELPPDPNEKHYVRNAGLVLLHPFFSVYFTRLGILQDNLFINHDARMRAVHLLQYLVDGAPDAPEPELVLNKLLCNIPLEDPVKPGITLTEQEKIVSAEMLTAVISHWEKLKNTSIEGLQASFLQRDGALHFKDEAWRLKVETRGYDVLLQTLPWSISLIKMPWMNDALYLEWT
jgi:hypothetical protein